MYNSEIPPNSRVCVLSRGDISKPYGFDLRTTDDKHIAVNIPCDHLAYQAGMRDQDHIVKVNGNLIDTLEHEEVVDLIMSNPYRVELVLNSTKDESRVSQGKSHSLHDIINILVLLIFIRIILGAHHNLPKTRLCVLKREKETDSFGFSLTEFEGNHIVEHVVANSAASRAGLQDHDFIMRVNGNSVEGLTHEQVVSLISSKKVSVDILVLNSK
jgi:C-terminal processing protease CtpA/Prc